MNKDRVIITIIKDAFYVLRPWYSSHMRHLFSYRIKGEPYDIFMDATCAHLI